MRNELGANRQAIFHSSFFIPHSSFLISHFSLTPSIPARLTLTSITPFGSPVSRGTETPQGQRRLEVKRSLCGHFSFLISHFSFFIPHLYEFEFKDFLELVDARAVVSKFVEQFWFGEYRLLLFRFDKA